jgi:hypothetical protein
MGFYDVEWFQQLRTKITRSLACMHANQCTQIEAAVVNYEDFFGNINGPSYAGGVRSSLPIRAISWHRSVIYSGLCPIVG